MALDHFASGEFFVFEPCGGLAISDRRLNMRVASKWKPDTITRERAENEISRALRNLGRLRSSSDRFAALTEGLPLHVVLLYDYDTGGLEMCEQSEGEFRWCPGYPWPPAA